MNREIKFRAWDTVNKGWIESFVLNQDGKVHNTPYPVEPVLMQFTNLRDKNGVEIYEGDLVKHRKLDRPSDGIMYGLQEQFMDEPREVKFEGCGFTPLAGWVEDAVKDMEWEVVGNIYETP